MSSATVRRSMWIEDEQGLRLHPDFLSDLATERERLAGVLAADGLKSGDTAILRYRNGEEERGIVAITMPATLTFNGRALQAVGATLRPA